MADRYKEGRDYELVPMKDKDGDIVKDGRGGSVKTRRFFTKAEKEAMKAKDKPKAKPKAKAAPKASTVDTTDNARAARTNSSERYGTGSGPRTAAPKRSSSESSSSTPMGGPRRGRKPASTSNEGSPNAMTDGPSLSAPKSSGGAPVIKSEPDSGVSSGYGSLANAGNRMESYKVSRQDRSINGVTFEEWKKLSRSDRVEKNLPLTNQEFMKAMRLKGEDPAPSVVKRNSSTARSDDAKARATRTNRSRNSPDIPGMAKGGMVKKGTKDYKKSGMFYKSGSPRGYK